MIIQVRSVRAAAISASLAVAMSASSSVVVTQSADRASFSLWLLSMALQQMTAHQQVAAMHDIVVVEEFTADAVVGADVVYISPAATGELQLTVAEIDALEDYAMSGGRLIIPADNGIFADDFEEIAARFGVTYGDSFFGGIAQANVLMPNHPLFNGPAGVVETFSAASGNNSMTSDNPDFQVLATWDIARNAVGYLPSGSGEVIFLTDFNTFDDDMLADFDNNTLWLNLFETSGAPAGDLDGDGSVGPADLAILLSAWGICPLPPPVCAEDLTGDLFVGPQDLAILLGHWG